MSPTALDYARAYANRGWSVIPVVRGSKVPAIEWKEYQEYAAEDEQLEEWFSDSEYDVGIVTGSVSALCVVDFDGQNATRLVDLPRTATVRTPHGEHWYYQYNDSDIHNAAKLWAGDWCAVDIRGEGGYVVAPPSRGYTWAVRPSEALESLPMEVIARSEQRYGKQEGWTEKYEGGVSVGERNDALARVAGRYLKITRGDHSAVLDICRMWNRLNDQPLGDRELEATVHSICRRQERMEPSGTKLYTIDEIVHEITTQPPRKGVVVNVPGIEEIGGLVPGEMIVVAGRPGAGKSTYATQLCVEAGVRTGIPTLVATCEMTRKMWGTWMASHAGNYSLDQNEEEKPVPKDACRELVGKNIYVLDHGINVDTISKYARSIKNIGLIVVDHVGLVEAQRRDTRTLEVKEIVLGLHRLAGELECTILLLSQLNREVEKRDGGRPRMSDLRECGEVEQTAAHVLFVHGREGQPTRKLIVGKSRFRSGIEDMSIMFDESRKRFIRY